jgi:hypothetical protein
MCCTTQECSNFIGAGVVKNGSIMSDLLHETALALGAEWQLMLPDNISEEAILELLTARVVVILERGPETFFQLMYRLDISEKKLNAILDLENVAAKIARLIYDRQLQKIRSRLVNKMTRETDDPDLQW